MATLNPCRKCGRPAVVLDGRVEGTWEIGCWGEDCDSTPIVFRAGDDRSRAAAVRTWNQRWKKKEASNAGQ